jgi:hypothetical protein
VGHLAGIIVGYSIAWGLIQGMTNYWSLVLLGWICLACVYSLKRTNLLSMQFLEIESVEDPTQVGLLAMDTNGLRDGSQHV